MKSAKNIPALAPRRARTYNTMRTYPYPYPRTRLDPKQRVEAWEASHVGLLCRGPRSVLGFACPTSHRYGEADAESGWLVFWLVCEGEGWWWVFGLGVMVRGLVGIGDAMEERVDNKSC